MLRRNAASTESTHYCLGINRLATIWTSALFTRFVFIHKNQPLLEVPDDLTVALWEVLFIASFSGKFTSSFDGRAGLVGLLGIFAPNGGSRSQRQ